MVFDWLNLFGAALIAGRLHMPWHIWGQLRRSSLPNRPIEPSPAVLISHLIEALVRGLLRKIKRPKRRPPKFVQENLYFNNFLQHNDANSKKDG